MSRTVCGTTTPLLANETFVSQTARTLEQLSIVCVIMSSTPCTLYIEQSDSPSGPFNPSTLFTVLANQRFCYGQPISKSLFRIRLINSDRDQTYLSLNTVLYNNYIEDSDIRYQNTPILDLISRKRITSAFNEPLSTRLRPIVQLSGLYPARAEETQTYTALGGTTGVSNGLITCTTGTNVGGYGVYRSKKTIRYRPGIGTVCRFTAKFDTPVANSTQRAGFFLTEAALQIGYDGLDFGVLRQKGSLVQIVRLTISAPHNQVSGTITLGGVGYAVTLDGDTISEVCDNLVSGYTFNGLWLFDHDGTAVYFMSANTGVTSVPSINNINGTIEILQQGVNDSNQNHWTHQSSFNVDTIDGTGVSGMVLDPQKLNVYQIEFRWLGVGTISYSVESSFTGELMLFHQEHYSNRNVEPHLRNPSMKLGYVVFSQGSTTNITIQGGSIMGGVQGETVQVFYPDSIHTYITDDLDDKTYYRVLALHNGITRDGTINTSEIQLKNMHIAVKANDMVQALFFIDSSNYPYTGKTNLFSYFNGTATEISAPSTMPVYTCSFVNCTKESFTNIDIILYPGDTLSVVLYSDKKINTVSADLNFVVD